MRVMPGKAKLIPTSFGDDGDFTPAPFSSAGCHEHTGQAPPGSQIIWTLR